MKVIYYQFTSLDSTQSFAKRESRSFSQDDLHVIQALEQTQGRGRMGKTWYSPPGKNLYLTFAFFTHKRAPFFFSQLATLALYDVLKSLGVESLIKWPNDLLVHEKKISGCLVEVQEVEGKDFIALGIGLNVNMADHDLQHVPQKATSLLIETKKEQDLEKIKELIVLEFLNKLKYSSQEEIESRWLKQVHWMLGRRITVNSANTLYEGTLLRIENDGKITLLLDNSTERVISSGEII